MYSIACFDIQYFNLYMDDKIYALDYNEKEDDGYYSMTVKFMKEYLDNDQVELSKIYPIYSNVVIHTSAFSNIIREINVYADFCKANENIFWYMNHCDKHGATVIFRNSDFNILKKYIKGFNENMIHYGKHDDINIEPYPNPNPNPNPKKKEFSIFISSWAIVSVFMLVGVGYLINKVRGTSTQ